MLETTTLPRTIAFSCPGCGKRFSVPAGYAGRKANCKSCHGPIVVPPADAPSVQAVIEQNALHADRPLAAPAGVHPVVVE